MQVTYLGWGFYLPIIKVRLTKTGIAGLKFTTTGQQEYQDTVNSELRMTVGKDTKAFIVKSSYKGLPKYTTLGHFPAMLPDEALELAQTYRAHFSKHGTWPDAKREEATLRNALASRERMMLRADARERSIRQSNNTIHLYFSDWFDIPLASITRPMLEDRYEAIYSKKGLPRGVGPKQRGSKPTASAAKQAIKYLQAAYNRAIIDYPNAGLNPAIFYKFEFHDTTPKKREYPATPEGIAAVWTAILNRNDRLSSVFFAIKLYTGLRLPSLTAIKWSDVDLDRAILTVRESKRREGFKLPLSRQLVEMFKLLPRTNSEWCFPSASSASGHAEFKSAAWLPCTIHDLRRIWRTVAKVAEVPDHHVRLLGHWKTDEEGKSQEQSEDYVLQMWTFIAPDQQRISDKLDELISGPPLSSMQVIKDGY